jgi:GH25 family lysozyme M1 (1,4-beta-N-acetylmuramidase)
VDPNAKSTIANAHSAGIPHVDIYHFPCVSQSGQSQAQAVNSAISASSYGTVWIDVEINPSTSCAWKDAITNCNFLTSLVSAYETLGKTVGIYASSYQW